MSPTIRRIDVEAEIAALRLLVNEAFGTVALELGLSPENAGSNPAFATEAELLDAARKRGQLYYGAYDGERLVGCYALEPKAEGLAYLERLAVAPSARHGGLGRSLVADASRRAAELGASRLSIGIIEENARLKAWYLRLGFVLGETRRFAHLPFTVRYMELAIGGSSA